jgi:Tfp pilus assembly protein PilN
MDKTQALNELLDRYEASDSLDIPELCERVWDAAIAHVSQQIEAKARTDEAVRRLQHMHQAHSDSVQWYQNAVAQALKSLDALPDKLEFKDD